MNDRARFLGFFLLLAATGVAAQELTRVLLPIQASGVPGAHGSVWVTTTWVTSTAEDRSIFIAPRVNCGPITCPEASYLEPNMPPLLFAPVPTASPGLLFFVETPGAEHVHFSARIADVSRDAFTAGTELPMVPEAEFTGDKIVLLDVPTRSGFRDALRVYALPETPAPRVTVRYRRMPATADDRDTSVLYTASIALQEYGDVAGRQIQPSAVVIGELQAMPELEGQDAIAIEISPETSGLRIWALASITNNETQQVTLVTPQRAVP